MENTMSKVESKLSHTESMDAAMVRLYGAATARQWDLDNDIDWAHLSLESLAPNVRRAMGSIYSYILFCERFGLDLCRTMVEVAPEGWVRRFALMQVNDEKRHVDFFTRVVDRLDCRVRISSELGDLASDLKSLRCPIELLLHAQVVEIAAQSLFVDTARRSRSRLRAAVRMPGAQSAAVLLDTIIKYISRDESTHIAFGMHYLRSACQSLPQSELRRLQALTVQWCGSYIRSFRELKNETTVVGLPVDALVQRVAMMQERQLRRVGLNVQLSF
jgi:hypothetical protein